MDKASITALSAQAKYIQRDEDQVRVINCGFEEQPQVRGSRLQVQVGKQLAEKDTTCENSAVREFRLTLILFWKTLSVV